MSFPSGWQTGVMVENHKELDSKVLENNISIDLEQPFLTLHNFYMKPQVGGILVTKYGG